MDMLSYFLGRLAGGGSGGSGGSEGTVYTDVIYNEDGSITFIDTEGQEHLMECEYVEGRLEKVKIDGITLDAMYEENTNKLIKLGDIEIDVGEYPSEIGEIEDLINNSGVLEDTEGSVTEKVEQLIEKAGVTGIIFSDYNSEGQPRKLDLSSIPPNVKVSSPHFVYDSYTVRLFRELREVKINNTFTKINARMFAYCTKFVNLYGDLTNITIVDNMAFGGCTSLVEIPYMPKLETIMEWAFWQCTALTKVKLPNKIKTISSNAFSECENLEHIYCPWEEGAVANAPWGATNATIHYNYVEGEETNAES